MLSTGLDCAILHDCPNTHAKMITSKAKPTNTYMGQPNGTWVEKADSHRWLT